MNDNLSEIKDKVIKGIASLVIREFLIKAITAAGQLIIIRILTPVDFGIFAIIAFLSGLVSLMSDLGLSQAIIQHKLSLTQKYLSTVFFVKQILITMIVLLLVLLAPYVSKIYPQINSGGVLMLRVLLVLYLLDPLNTTVISLIERKLKFYVIPRVDIAGIIIYYTSLIYFAVRGYGVWSFIIALVLKKVLETIVLFFHEPWIPSATMKFALVKNSIRFGFYLHLGNVLGYFQRSMPTAIAGLVTNSYNIGILDWSNNAATFANSINENYGRVAFSGFSRIQSSKKALSIGIRKSMNYLLLYANFITILILGFGKEIIYYVATPKWLPALFVLQIFTISIIFASMLTVLVQALTAMGKSKEIFYPSFWIISFGWVLGLLGSRFLSFNFLAIDYTLVMAGLFIAFYIIARQNSLKIDLISILRTKLTVFLFTFMLVIIFNNFSNGFGFFLFKIAFISCSYISLVYIFDKDNFLSIIRLIRINFSNKGSA